MLFSRSIVWIGKKVITYCLKTPFIPISANLVVFCRSVTRLKTRAGLAGAGFVRKIASKSHRNRIKNRMCKRAFKDESTLQRDTIRLEKVIIHSRSRVCCVILIIQNNQPIGMKWKNKRGNLCSRKTWFFEARYHASCGMTQYDLSTRH